MLMNRIGFRIAAKSDYLRLLVITGHTGRRADRRLTVSDISILSLFYKISLNEIEFADVNIYN